MKTYRKTYCISWCLMVALFNLIVFLSPAGRIALRISLPTFVVGYCGVMVALLVQLVCSLRELTATSAEKLFLRIPVLRLAQGCLILSVLLGSVCMAVPILPDWLATVAAAAVLVFYIIAMLKASTAGELVAERHRQVEDKTALMYSLRDNVQRLIARTGDEVDRAACEKLCEALRYSDPMTSDAVASYDARLSDKCAQLREAVLHGGGDVQALAEEARLLLEERNMKCRMSK